MFYPYKKRKLAFDRLVDNLKSNPEPTYRIDILCEFAQEERKICHELNIDKHKSQFYEQVLKYMRELGRHNVIREFDCISAIGTNERMVYLVN